MQVVHEVCCGLDVHKKSVTAVCCGPPGGGVRPGRSEHSRESCWSWAIGCAPVE